MIPLKVIKARYGDCIDTVGSDTLLNLAIENGEEYEIIFEIIKRLKEEIKEDILAVLKHKLR